MKPLALEESEVLFGVDPTEGIEVEMDAQYRAMFSYKIKKSASQSPSEIRAPRKLKIMKG